MPRNTKATTKAQQEEMRRLIQQGHSQVEIAAQFGVSPATVSLYTRHVKGDLRGQERIALRQRFLALQAQHPDWSLTQFAAALDVPRGWVSPFYAKRDLEAK